MKLRTMLKAKISREKLMDYIQEDRDFHHMRPYYDNPNFPTAEGTQHTYYWDGKKFGTHLKGGISENKMSNKMERDKWLRNL